LTFSAVAARYANALADVVTGPASTVQSQQVTNELRSFQSLLHSSVELHNALTSPAVPTVRKRAVIGRIADQLSLSRVTRNFLYVLVDRRRITHLAAAIDLFEKAIDERLGYTQAEVISAADLGEGQRVELIAELEQRFGSKLRPRFTVDKSLIGGVIARVGSTVYDGSVRGQLQVLGKRLEA
jgi:F-type H+-transporting ATPase subunit delta